MPRKTHCEVEKRRELCGESFCRSHADFCACLRQIRQLTRPYHGAVIDVAYRKPGQHSLRVDMLKRSQRVSRLSRLRDTDYQCVREEDGLSVAELGGYFNLTRQARQRFYPMLCHQARMVARATCENLDGRDARKYCCGNPAKRVITSDTLAVRVAQTRGLLENFLEHIVLMTTQTLFVSL